VADSTAIHETGMNEKSFLSGFQCIDPGPALAMMAASKQGPLWRNW